MALLPNSCLLYTSEQAKQCTLATEVNALAITKLDGTAKGGVVIGISDQDVYKRQPENTFDCIENIISFHHDFW